MMLNVLTGYIRGAGLEPISVFTKYNLWEVIKLEDHDDVVINFIIELMKVELNYLIKVCNTKYNPIVHAHLNVLGRKLLLPVNQVLF